MLEKTPHFVGRALRGVRAGFGKILSEDDAFVEASPCVSLESPAFQDSDALPARFTADGVGLSPPLAWRNLPDGTHGLVLLVEDPDAPTPEPLVHLLAFDLKMASGEIAEGVFRSPAREGTDEELGRNAYFKTAWLPPDPPTGHGVHRYAFQLFALNRRLAFERPPRRSEVAAAMVGHVLARGLLLGTYARP